ncbi:MAG: ATP-binding protein [Gammaproteobacteria bacterium]|nr:ATP-binding protein [Gammaproteobacteria bacterium]
MSQIFPIGIATGDAFCNRVAERAHLIKNIKNNRHTVLLAPRRYGKTSLVNQVMTELKLPYGEMDFLLCANSQAVKMKIVEKIAESLFQLLPKTQQAKEKILSIFKKMRPEILLSAGGQKVILHMPDNEPSSEQTICDVLMNLDKTAVAMNKKIVIFMDEFQQVGQLDDSHTVEAAIRHAVERSHNVSYVFSGSNRHMLLQMFGEKSRPFYKLCETMILKRISEVDYTAFIQKQSKIKWKKELSSDALQFILSLSERHPYYVNLIGNHLWLEGDFPHVEKIELFWKYYIESEKSIFVSELSSLSNNQKIVLVALAKKPTLQPFQIDYLKMTGLTISSQKQALNKLILRDFVFTNELGMVCVLDPAMRSYINGTQ